MKVLVVELRAMSDSEVASGIIMIQRRRGDVWLNESQITVVSGQPGAQRELPLEDSQRLVIEATSNTQVVYDRAQSAAVVQRNVPVPEPSPPDADGDEDTGSIAEAAIQGQGYGDAMAQERRDAALSAARQKLAEMAKPAPAPVPPQEPVPEPQTVREPPAFPEMPAAVVPAEPEPAIDPVPPSTPAEPTPAIASSPGPRVKLL